MTSLGQIALVGADLAALLGLPAQLGEVARGLTAPQLWVERVGPDAAATALAATALWAVALWLGLGLLAVLVAHLPGATGRAAHRVARTLLPRAVYRLAAGATGLGLLLAPVAAGAQTVPLPATTTSAPVPVPSWPRSGDEPALPAPALPRSAPSTAQAPTPAPRPAPTRAPTRAPAAPSAPSRTPSPPSPPSTGADVVVRPGDTLWSIAARHVPAPAAEARIAAEWPRWFGANRATIGADPALITPGEVLHAPATTQEAGPS
ncbi:MAG: LysM peptidoglycan-binding domain-containing protein [Jatrophihabitantaceae bacterium]